MNWNANIAYRSVESVLERQSTPKLFQHFHLLLVGLGVGEWLFMVGMRGGLFCDSGVSLKSGSIMVGVVDAWSDEGAIVLVCA